MISSLGTTERAAIPKDVVSYLAHIPETRRDALYAIHDAIMRLYPDSVVSMKYKMPTYERAGSWMSLGNQKAHYAIYTCSPLMIAPYLEKHPEIRSGKGCLRIRDTQTLDLNDLEEVIRITLAGKPASA